MERIIEIIKEWGFKEGTKGFYYKFVTPDSIVVFDFAGDCVTIKFRAYFGEPNEEHTKVEESYKMSYLYESKDAIEFTIKGIILRLAMNVHRKYLFNE